MAEFKHLVRIANTDLKGQKALVYALKDIKGVGVPFAHAVCSILRIDGLSKIGNISDSDMKRVDEVIKLPEKFGIPFWMFNRQKDIDTGLNKHLVANDLIFHKDNDIKLMRRIKSYRGVRHSLNQPVRGQKTRSNFRANKGKVVGVKTAGKKKGAS